MDFDERDDIDRCPGLGKATVVPSGHEQQAKRKRDCPLCDGTGLYEVFNPDGTVKGCAKCPHPPAAERAQAA